MAEISNTELNEIIQRATTEVQRETKAEETKGFGVTDLKSQLTDIVNANGGAGRAWKVSGSYDTSGTSSVRDGLNVIGSGSSITPAGPTLARAWKVEIKYDTSNGNSK